jgi:hypothetical protein
MKAGNYSTFPWTAYWTLVVRRRRSRPSANHSGDCACRVIASALHSAHAVDAPARATRARCRMRTFHDASMRLRSVAHRPAVPIDGHHQLSLSTRCA